MRYAFIALVLGLLLVGCSDSAAETPPAPEPWTVVAVTQSADRPGLRIEYTTPTGAIVAWDWHLENNSPDVVKALLACWRSARVGEPLPECAKSPNEIATATP